MTPLRLGSHYQLEERIGEGSLGVVWRGTDTVTGAACAIKVLRPEHAQDPATVARFVRERTALLRFRHPNVVALHDMIVEGDQLALVMDLVADGDLAAYRKRCGGTLDPAEATELTAQACAGLAAAHAAGIVHRDLKPANILLDGGQVKLTDFGIALVTGEAAITTEGVFLGTLHYLAPEVIRGDEPTAACDSYAVGVTLYELLAGRTPFTGVPAAIMHGHLHLTPERPDGIPDAAWQVIAECLDKDPDRRPGAAELERVLRSEAGTQTAPGKWRRSAGWPGLAAAWDRDTVARTRALESGPGAIAMMADAGLARLAGRRGAAGGGGAGGGCADGYGAGLTPACQAGESPASPRRGGWRSAATARRRFWFGWALGLLAVAVAGVIAVCSPHPVAGNVQRGRARRGRHHDRLDERGGTDGERRPVRRIDGNGSAGRHRDAGDVPGDSTPGKTARADRHRAAVAQPHRRVPDPHGAVRPGTVVNVPRGVTVRHAFAIGFLLGDGDCHGAGEHRLALRGVRTRHAGDRQGHRPDAPGVHPRAQRETGLARRARRHGEGLARADHPVARRRRGKRHRHLLLPGVHDGDLHLHGHDDARGRPVDGAARVGTLRRQHHVRRPGARLRLLLAQARPPWPSWRSWRRDDEEHEPVRDNAVGNRARRVEAA